MNFSKEQLGRMILDYDPTNPQPEFFATATEMAATGPHYGNAAGTILSGRTCSPARSSANPPASQDPLPAADVLVVTGTVAEAVALATLFTPGVSLAEWFEYTHNLDAFIPNVTGKSAPFNDPTHPRYYHSLGLYYPVQLVGKDVLCFKWGFTWIMTVLRCPFLTSGSRFWMRRERNS